jgi:hypothetical protein
VVLVVLKRALQIGKGYLITGGNGIIGSAIFEHPCQETTRDQYLKNIVKSRSPFEYNVEDPRIVFIALDFTDSPTTLTSQM